MRQSPSSAKVVRPAHLRRLLECEQVAAVCYRIRDENIEFLLVRTGGGRWTFPKGGTEPGLTHAQAAALEAFEEAGVHGRIEEVSFARYVRHRQKRPPAKAETVVHAHLCEVLRLGRPQEGNRAPTWFSADKAKKCLRQDRGRKHGAELARVVDHAVLRIRRLHSANSDTSDALQKVQFESFENAPIGGSNRASFFHSMRGRIAHS